MKGEAASSVAAMVGEADDYRSEISFDEALRLYQAILRETGGEYGFVSEGTLRYILDALTWMHGDVFSKAAYVIREIAGRHPLVNGNKRLAFALGALLLRRAGYELSVGSDETIALMLRVARAEVSSEELESWLRSRSKKI
jgi:death-on-curing family protein